MSENTPRPYEQWRTIPADHAEDAANLFGYHLMRHCRDVAVKAAKFAVPMTEEEFKAQIAVAVDTALHNVMDLLEGFFRTEAGPEHRVEYGLSVTIKKFAGSVVERIEISLCRLDLPIGYWKWKDGEFQ